MPYLQLPLVLDFFASQDRATYLFNPERLGAERGGCGLWWVEHKMGRFTNKYRAKWLRAGLYYQPRPQTSRKIKAFRHWHPATRDVPHFFWNWSLTVVAQATNIHPGGYSDLNLQLNVYFVLAGPCELQLHICKEFDQIPFSKCLKAGFWAVSFWYMHALLINVFFFECFHPKASLCNCRPVAWNKCFSWTHRHCHCCASVLIPAISHDVTCNIFSTNAFVSA